jgi:hypothetical protein
MISLLKETKSNKKDVDVRQQTLRDYDGGLLIFCFSKIIILLPVVLDYM